MISGRVGINLSQRLNGKSLIQVNWLIRIKNYLLIGAQTMIAKSMPLWHQALNLVKSLSYLKVWPHCHSLNRKVLALWSLAVILSLKSLLLRTYSPWWHWLCSLNLNWLIWLLCDRRFENLALLVLGNDWLTGLWLSSTKGYLALQFILTNDSKLFIQSFRVLEQDWFPLEWRFFFR